jgi:DNA-binding NarL/FixJ family response regulator
VGQQQLRIVVAEDEMIIALDMKRKLERLGHRVVSTVNSGAAAIAEAKKLQPDLLVMDIGLKGPIDGVRAVNAIWKEKRIPVVFVSAYSDESTLQEVAQLRPAGIVMKPVAEEDLLATVQSALAGNAPTSNPVGVGQPQEGL